MLFPPKAFAKLVKDTREQASMAGKDDMHLTRGDILAAFLLKVDSFLCGNIIDPNSISRRYSLTEQVLSEKFT